MALKAPKGCVDLIGKDARAWERFCAVAADVFTRYGYERIELPTFEQVDLFVRGCGETTDVATKEIFSVLSIGAAAKLREGGQLKADQRLALRPEGTASVVRAVAQHNLIPQGGAPVKLYYAGPMFRCERPQKGRLREFHQVGIECLGAIDATADAEMIIVCMRFFEALGLQTSSMELLINSMGCPECRPAYAQKVAAYMHEHEGELCEECVRRAETNPLRAFDCKNSGCFDVMEGAPRFEDELCEHCRERFAQVKAALRAAGLDYRCDSRLVRGFDYYTGTVFEVQVTEGLGSQSAIGGGGRYDKLMAEVGGNDVCGLGFAVGFERIVLALEAAGVQLAEEIHPQVYVACVDATVRDEAFQLVQDLRDAGIFTLYDQQGRSLKSQFKLADKSGATYCLILGPEELAAGQAKLRHMQTHDERPIALASAPQEILSLI